MLTPDSNQHAPVLLGASEPAHPISLVVIDDNRLLREGITLMLSRQTGFTVLASSADVARMLAAMPTMAPTIVLLDFGLADDDSLEVCAQISALSPTTHVVVMGVGVDAEGVAPFIRAGADGFIMKDASIEEFTATIRVVASGEQKALPRALTPSLFAQIVRDEVVATNEVIREAVGLTTRERQIMALLGEGLSNKEISARLHIAVHTVKSHVHNILEKLSLHTRLEVAAYTHYARHSNER